MNYIIGVTGSISAYKAYELVRELSKKNNNIIVALTFSAQKIVTPETFIHLGADLVIGPNEELYGQSDFLNIHGPILHISISRWADQFVIYPATAHLINSYSHGLCSQFLLSSLLACPKDCPITIFPSMNTNMYQSNQIKRSFEILKEIENLFIAPTEYGTMACMELGEGKITSTDFSIDIIESHKRLSHVIPKHRKLEKNKKILISTGATRTYIDPIRFMSNPSTGVLGYYLALDAGILGNDVTLIYTQSSVPKLAYLKSFKNIRTICTDTNDQMLESVLAFFPIHDFFISAAAITDFDFPTEEFKLPKEKLNNLRFSLAKDILHEISKIKKTNQKIISFTINSKLESVNWIDKFKNRKVDYIISNKASNAPSHHQPQGFGDVENEYIFYDKDQKKLFRGTLSKKDILIKLVMLNIFKNFDSNERTSNVDSNF